MRVLLLRRFYHFEHKVFYNETQGFIVYKYADSTIL